MTPKFDSPNISFDIEGLSSPDNKVENRDENY